MSVERKQHCQHRIVSLTIVSCLGTAPAGNPSAEPRPIANEAEMKKAELTNEERVRKTTN
jgi:hypothetical protein